MGLILQTIKYLQDGLLSLVLGLVYSYISNPIQTVKERSPQHYGTIAFDIIEKPERKLIGEYWADRKTTGQVELTYWKKIKLEQYPKLLGRHPVSKDSEL